MLAHWRPRRIIEPSLVRITLRSRPPARWRGKSPKIELKSRMVTPLAGAGLVRSISRRTIAESKSVVKKFDYLSNCLCYAALHSDGPVLLLGQQNQRQAR